MSATQRAGPLSMSSFKTFHRNVARHVCSLLLSFRSDICFFSVRYVCARVLDKLTLKICVQLVLMRMGGKERIMAEGGTQFGFCGKKRENGAKKKRKIKWMKNIRTFLFFIAVENAMRYSMRDGIGLCYFSFSAFWWTVAAIPYKIPFYRL